MFPHVEPEYLQNLDCATTKVRTVSNSLGMENAQMLLSTNTQTTVKNRADFVVSGENYYLSL